MRRILIVDDHPHLRAALRVVLQANGFETVEASDFTSGLGEFDASHFDLAIVDIYMPPDLDGVQLIKALRLRSPRMPVIAMSGIKLSDTHRTALDFFPSLPKMSEIACLQKPFRPAQLLAAIEAVLPQEHAIQTGT